MLRRVVTWLKRIKTVNDVIDVDFKLSDEDFLILFVVVG